MTESKSKRGLPKFPKDYLLDMAGHISTINPDKNITYNVIRNIWINWYNAGYFRRIDDNRVFNEARNAAIKKSFDNILTCLDDDINQK